MADYNSALTGAQIDERLAKVPELDQRVSQLSAEKVSLTAAEYTEDQKAQARENIGATTLNEVADLIYSNQEPQNLLADVTWSNGYASWGVPVTTCTAGEVYATLPELTPGKTYVFEHVLPSSHAPSNWCCFVSFDEAGNRLERFATENATGYEDDGTYSTLIVEITPTKAYHTAYLSYRTHAYHADSPTDENKAAAIAWAEGNTLLYDPNDNSGGTLGSERLLPVVSSSDNGKTLRVDDGKWAAVEKIIPASINPNIKSINHRGYSSVAPENTLSAYRLSKAMGFDYVECDVSFTSDGYAVLLHDDTIDRTSNGTGVINELTFEYVRSLDFGSWKSEDYAGEQIPTFQEFMTLCRRIGLHPYIELKDIPTQEQVNELVATVKSIGMIDKVTWISASASAVGQLIKNAHPSARIGVVCSDLTEYVVTVATNLKSDENVIFVDAHSGLTNELIAALQDANLPLEVWSIDSNDGILNTHEYVSGFTTDKLIAGVVLYENAL